MSGMFRKWNDFQKIICDTVWLWSAMWPTSSKIEDLSASDSLWIFNVSRRLCSGKVGRWSRGYYNFCLSVRLESYYLFWFVKMRTVISFDAYSRWTRISRMSPIRTFSGFFSICDESDEYSFPSYHHVLPRMQRLKNFTD